jgi:hypothetical protein
LRRPSRRLGADLPSGGQELVPNEEAYATMKLAGEEERIARKYDMCPGWTIEDYERGMAETRARAAADWE